MVRPGPRRWDELGPSKTKICKKIKQKFVTIWEGSELVLGSDLVPVDVNSLRGVRSGPRRWDEVGPASENESAKKIGSRGCEQSERGLSWSWEIG